MNKTITPAITITIEGGIGSGKTTLLNLIGSTLLREGVNAQCIERLTSGADEESYNIEPKKLSPKKWDNRLIQVVALEKHGKQKIDGAIYSLITPLVHAEIQRLVDKYRQQTPDDYKEIYLEWAYGVFLSWKAIVGSSINSDDEDFLEALATGELAHNETPF